MYISQPPKHKCLLIPPNTRTSNSHKMPMNLPPLPVTLPLDENKTTPPLPPSSSYSSSLPPDLPLAHDQSAAATEIHNQMLRCPLSSASGDTTVDIVEAEEDEEETRAKEELKLKDEEEDKEETRAKEEHKPKELEKKDEEMEANKKKDWIKEMRGWLMILATLAASVTYSAGLNPPGGFWQDDSKPSPDSGSQAHTAGNPVLADKSPTRYTLFFVSNTMAFGWSIAIIVLLLNPSIFQTEVRLLLLKGFVVGDMFTLMVAFGAGSTRRPQDTAGIVFLSVLTFLYLPFWAWQIKKIPFGEAANVQPGKGCSVRSNRATNFPRSLEGNFA